MNSPIAGKKFRWGSLVAVLIIAALAYPLSKSFLLVFSLKENALEFTTVIGLLGPALVASLFVERAVEVVVTTWRKLGRDQKETELSALESEQKAAPSNVNISKTIKDTKSAIVEYRQETLQMAVGFSIAFSFILTLAGVRLLTQFFEIPYIDCLTGLEIEPEECPSGLDQLKSHFRWLTGFDILITTLIIAGGSEGLHSIVSAITSFADKTASK